MEKREVEYLKKVFATFGCKDTDIREIVAPDSLFCSFAVNTEGCPIEAPECGSFFTADDNPWFCILSRKGSVLQLDFCIELTFVLDYLVGLYLKDDYDDLGVYFISDENKVPYCVEFGAAIHCKGDCETVLTVENFGTVKSGEICNRAVYDEKSNLLFKEYFKGNLGDSYIWVDGYFLSNVMDLRLVNPVHETYADAFRFATTIDELDYYMSILKKDDYSFKVIVNTHLMCVETANEVEEEFEHGKDYWRSIYKEGLEE